MLTVEKKTQSKEIRSQNRQTARTCSSRGLASTYFEQMCGLTPFTIYYLFRQLSADTPLFGKSK